MTCGFHLMFNGWTNPLVSIPGKGKGSKARTSHEGKIQEHALSALKARTQSCNHDQMQGKLDNALFALNGLVKVKIPLMWRRRTHMGGSINFPTAHPFTYPDICGTLFIEHIQALSKSHSVCDNHQIDKLCAPPYQIYNGGIGLR